MEGVEELKAWIRSFSKKEGRKPQAADMPADIRELQSVPSRPCLPLTGPLFTHGSLLLQAASTLLGKAREQALHSLPQSSREVSQPVQSEQ